MNTPIDELISYLPPGENWRPALAWLGTQEWVTPKLAEDYKTEIVTTKLPLYPPTPEISKTLQALVNLDCDKLVVNALAQSLANGQKVLRPTVDQCRSMEQVAINLKHEDYHQPYPAIFVELPSEYRQELEERFGFDCPRYLLCWHDPKSKYIVTLARCDYPHFMFCINAPRYERIEDGLGITFEAAGADLEILETIGRIAINMCLMLTYLGVKEKPYLSHAQMVKLIARTKNKKRNKAQRAQSELDSLPKLLTFDQEIDFYTTEKSLPDDGPHDGDGTPK